MIFGFKKVISFIKQFYKTPKHGHIKKLGRKFWSYEKLCSQIDTLILGSSHAQLGYRAVSNEFNLAMSFEDLYYSYKLFEKYQNPNLKKVILFYSVFSPGNQTIMTQYADVAAVFKAVAAIDYQDVQVASEKNLDLLFNGYLRRSKKIKSKFKYDISYRGNEEAYVPAFVYPTAAERAAKHYKNNQRCNNQTEYVVKMQKLAYQNGVELIVVIPPVTQPYKDSLPSSDKLFSELFTTASRYNIKVINMYDTSLFSDSDFIDYDHLNLSGAEKLTAQIKILAATPPLQ